MKHLICGFAKNDLLLERLLNDEILSRNEIETVLSSLYTVGLKEETLTQASLEEMICHILKAILKPSIEIKENHEYRSINEYPISLLENITALEEYLKKPIPN